MSAASASASACVAFATCRAAAARAPGSGRPCVAAHPSGVNDGNAGTSSAPVRAASRAGPDGSFAGSPKNVHLEPGGAQVAVRDQADEAARAQPSASAR